MIVCEVLIRSIHLLIFLRCYLRASYTLVHYEFRDIRTNTRRGAARMESTTGGGSLGSQLGSFSAGIRSGESDGRAEVSITGRKAGARGIIRESFALTIHHVFADLRTT